MIVIINCYHYIMYDEDAEQIVSVGNLDMGTNLSIADAVNVLGQFCGMRDVDLLNRTSLLEKYSIDQADVFVLFGGSILAGGSLLAQAIKDRIAKVYVIVGGAGHTTETLRQTVHGEYPGIQTAGLPEAEIFQKYIQEVYSCEADYLESKSTNCGNNITYLLNLLAEKNVKYSSIILCQDATMQRRMDAGLRKYAADDLMIINYASYRASVAAEDNGLAYSERIQGMWDMDRYVNLLMGEIPRLSDDENGYGPNGKSFIAHVDIPGTVYEAFDRLKSVYGETTREADPMYASDGAGKS